MRTVHLASDDKPPIEVTDENVEDLYERFLNDKALVEGANDRLGRLKAGLMAYAEANGIVDDGGHRWVTLDSGLQFKRQVSKKEILNEERIRAWLNDVGREDECTKLVPVFDEDTFWAIVDEEELTPAEIDAFYDVKNTYSFIPGKD